MKKEMVVAYFKALSRHLPGWAEEIHNTQYSDEIRTEYLQNIS
jgi:hypothetical protein